MLFIYLFYFWMQIIWLFFLKIFSYLQFTGFILVLKIAVFPCVLENLGQMESFNGASELWVQNNPNIQCATWPGGCHIVDAPNLKHGTYKPERKSNVCQQLVAEIAALLLDFKV